MPQVVEPDLRQSRPVQHPVKHMQHAVRRDGAAGGRGEHIDPAYILLLLPENFCGVRPDGEGAVGIFCFQRCFHHLPVDPHNLPPHRDRLLLQVDVLPMKPQQLPSPQPGSQLQVVELKYAAGFRLPEKRLQLVGGEGLHLPVFQSGQGSASAAPPASERRRSPGGDSALSWG